MKKAMKKLMAALLAVAMVCAMAIPAFAAEGAGAAHTGSITINGAINGQTYYIYRILNLEANADFTAYKYTINTGWETFVTEHNDVFTVKNGIVTSTVTDAATIQNLANEAGAYAKTNNLQIADTADSDNVTVRGLDLGYYLVVPEPGVVSSSLCSLGTTNPNVTINEKNGKPAIEKFVYRGEVGEPSNDAGIGDTVKFLITVAVIDGQPHNYIIHDAMSAGLTFNEASVVVTRHRETNNPITDPTPKLETLNEGSDYTVEKNTACTASTEITGCTFEIKFTDTALKANDVIMVQYTATVNENAVIGSKGNPNETILEYNKKYANKSTTKTYVWDMSVHKFADLGTGKENTPLENAEFRLYKEESGAKKYAKFTETYTGSSIYKLNNENDRWTADENAATKVKTPANGNIKFEGLDAGTYYLEETKAPTGYNTLTAPIKVVIESTLPAAGGTASYTVKYGDDSAEVNNHIIPVENKTGTTLPSTGGIGTTIFYVIGGGLMVAAAVLLITKKRMENH